MAKKNKTNRWIYILIGLLALVILLAILQKNKGDKPTEVYSAQATRTSIFETVGASGKIYPISEVKISSDVSGEIVELLVAEGDSVRQGQILARIDPEAFESQVEQAKASVNNAKANAASSEAALQNSLAQKEQIQTNLINTENIHERNTTLYNEGVISLADFEASLASLEALRANLRSAEANILGSRKNIEAAQYSVQSAEAVLKELRTSLRRTTITAPMSGIVASLSVELGERVVGTIQMTGTEMMRIANLNAMEVQVNVSESDILRVEIGDSVEIEVDAYFDKKFYGHVTHVANSASASSAIASADQVTNFVVKVSIEPQSYSDILTSSRRYAFRPGMSAAVEIFTEYQKDVLSVPIQAVTIRDKEDSSNQDENHSREEGDSYDYSDSEIDTDEIDEVVFLIAGDTASMKVIKTGIQDDRNIQVISGLKEGDEVITGPYSILSKSLKSGDRIDKKGKSKKSSAKDK